MFVNVVPTQALSFNFPKYLIRQAVYMYENPSDPKFRLSNLTLNMNLALFTRDMVVFCDVSGNLPIMSNIENLGTGAGMNMGKILKT